MAKRIDYIKVFLSLVIIVLLVLNLQPRQHRMSPHPHPNRMFKELHLTSAQLKQLEQHREQKRKLGREKMKATMKMHEQLMQEVVKDNPNQQKITQLISAINNQERVGLENMVKDMQELKTILTKAQLKMMFEQGKKRIKKDFPRPPF